MSAKLKEATSAAHPEGLHAKLVWVRSHIGAVEKSKTNTHLRYAYRTEDDYYNAVRPLLDEAGVMLYASTLGARLDAGFFVVEMEYTLVDAATGETVAVRAMGAGDAASVSKDGRETRDSSGLKKAQTGAARYFFQKTFLVADGTDDEEDHGRPRPVTADQRREIERLAGEVGIAPDDASQKAFERPVERLDEGQGQRLVALLAAKLRQIERERAAEATPAEADAEEVPPAPEIVEAFNRAVERDEDDPDMPTEPLVSVPFSYTGAKAAGRALRTKMLGELLASIGVNANEWIRDVKGIKRWRDVSEDRILELIEEAIRLEREQCPVNPEKAADLVSALSEKKISRAAITAKIRPSFKQFDQLSAREADELFVWIESAHSAG
jgi:hypothetical protein